MRLILQSNFYGQTNKGSFRYKKEIGFVNVNRTKRKSKRTWCSGFFERPVMWHTMIKRILKGKYVG